MRAISQRVLEVLLDDPFMKKCCLCGWEKNVQFHHNLIFAGRQVDEPFAILPLCKKCHDIADTKEIKQKLDWIMFNRATKEELIHYSKVRNLLAEKRYLAQIYDSFPAKV